MGGRFASSAGSGWSWSNVKPGGPTNSGSTCGILRPLRRYDLSADASAPVLFGREGERAEIGCCLDSARESRGSALAVVGEAGTGKTALLDDAHASAEGMRVVRVRGAELESEVAWAGLGDLLRPLTGSLAQLSDQQANALRSALALGPPMPVEPLGIFSAALTLLSTSAAEIPLLILVDDAHWLDHSSQAALAFVARRLADEAIALLVARRPEPGGTLTTAEIPALEVEEIDRSAAIELVTRTGPVDPSVMQEILAAAGGNPLALIEVTRFLSPDQRVGRAPLPRPLPIAKRLEGSILDRVAKLGARTRRALTLLAAADEAGVALIAEGLGELGLAMSDLEPAELVGLVTTTEGLAFSHPLYRSALYQSATPGERRAAHEALAAVLNRHGDTHASAWQRALATPAPDEDVAKALADAAATARTRGDAASAARTGERAAQLTPVAAFRAGRLADAARDWFYAGSPGRAKSLLNEARRFAEDLPAQLEIERLGAYIELVTGRPPQAAARLLAAAGRAEGLDGDLAAALFAEASFAFTFSGRVHDALKAAERGTQIAARGNGPGVQAATIAHAEALILRGEARRGRELLDQAAARVESGDALATLHVRQSEAGYRMSIGDLERAHELANGLVAQGRALGRPSIIVFPLATVGAADFRMGRWTLARAELTEALDLARETGQSSHAGFANSWLARLAAARGLEHEARSRAEETLEIADRTGGEAGRFYGWAALCLLELTLGNARDAARWGQRLAQLSEDSGLREPSIPEWQPDLIEACARYGEPQRAAAALEVLEKQAAQTQGLWALAVAARCRGLLTSDVDFEEHFAKALARHDRTKMPFERARTLLCVGERRRRAGRRVDAREPLREALGIFEHLGAQPWAERARAELRAAGTTVGSSPATGLLADQLTEHELRVAVAVAQGASNREVAANLFISPKTVDFHLRQIYRKLGISSRMRLAAALAAETTLR
jgi:DNA-binding CsgD family transcriptional regulator